MKKLKVLLKKIGRDSEIVEIDDTLEAKQKLVGGLIEVVPYGKHDLICNEEGKLIGLYPNCVFDYDMICGNFFLANSNYETGEFESLTDKEIEELKAELSKRSVEYTPMQMKAVYKQEKELDEEFETEKGNKLLDYYNNLSNDLDNSVPKEEIENLMNDVEKDLYYEPTEQDLKDMEEAYYSNKKKKQELEYEEFLANAKNGYDYEEREEI